jgi:hypothetical protein
LLGVTLLASAAPALACPDPTAPSVHVRIEDPDPQHDYGRSVAGLHALTGRPPPSALAGATNTLGVTSVRMAWRADLDAASRGGCARPRAVRIVLRHAEHVVRVATEVGKGCLFAQVLAHEERHVAVNRAALAEAGPALRAAVEAWWPTAKADGHGPLRDGLRAVMDATMAEIVARRDSAHAAIDNPVEYRRMSRVCPADQVRLRARLRGLDPPE